MKGFFENRVVTLVICPFDLRAGFERLSSVARACLDIDVSQGRDCVIFISKDRTLCKMIWADTKGNCTLVRKLQRGRFERFLEKAECPATRPLTPEDFARFINGEPLLMKRTGLLSF